MPLLVMSCLRPMFGCHCNVMNVIGFQLRITHHTWLYNCNKCRLVKDGIHSVKFLATARARRIRLVPKVIPFKNCSLFPMISCRARGQTDGQTDTADTKKRQSHSCFLLFITVDSGYGFALNILIIVCYTQL